MVFRGPPTLMPDAECLAIMQTNQLKSPLLRLPAELRQTIYNFALDINSGATALTLANGTIHLNISVSHNDYFWWSRWSLCLASRQLFAETSKDYFEQKFIVDYLQKHEYEELEELERNIKTLRLNQRMDICQIRLGRAILRQLFLRLSDGCPLLHFPNLCTLSMRPCLVNVMSAQLQLSRGRHLETFLGQKLGHHVTFDDRVR